jgi:alanine-glyoxylate transaminase / serine-glyoxylate transaminase / serine-pyruvate transaminase
MSSKSNISYKTLNPPIRTLLGPGPSNIHPRVEMAMLAPIVGHLDPYFVTIMEDTMNMLRAIFQTENELTFPISGTGSSGMEASIVNFVEPGDVVVIAVNGLFGERLADVAQRCGAVVEPLKAEWGNIIEDDDIKAALKKHKKVKLLGLVHAETSTGALQPLVEASRLAKEHDALFLVDTVTSLGGHEVALDKWGIDICYSGTQKCLSCPPGLSPFSVNKKALEVLKARVNKVQSWYLDLSLLSSYWSSSRFYHHTAPISMVYALHEALTLIIDEGIENRVKRHLLHGAALQAGLEAMGLKLHAQKGHRLATLTSVDVPEGVEDLKFRQRLLNEYSIEIGGGLGPLKGKIWRIGLMGHSSTQHNIILVLSAMETLLQSDGMKVNPGAGVNAALKVLSQK